MMCVRFARIGEHMKSNIIEFKPKTTPLDNPETAGFIIGYLKTMYGAQEVASILLESLNPLQREMLLKEVQ